MSKEDKENKENKVINISSPFPQPTKSEPALPLKRKNRKRLYWTAAGMVILVMIVASLLVWKTRYSAAKDDNTLYIAAAGPMTGNGQANGKAIVQAVQLYIDQINHKGGIHGKQVKLLVFDDQNKVDLAKQVALEIATQSKALAVIGHYYSSTSIAAAKIYQQYGIPAVTGTATADELTLNSDWYFRTIFNNSDQAALVANYIRKILNYEEANIIFDEDVFGTTLANTFTQAAKKVGLTIKNRWSFKNDDKVGVEHSINNLVSTFNALEEQTVLFAATHSKEGANIVTALRQLGHNNVQIFGADAFSSSGFTDQLRTLPQERTRPGYYTDGIYTTSPFLVDIASERAQEFKYDFVAKYDAEPTVTAAMYYDAAMVVLDALQTIPAPSQTVLNLAEQRTQIRDNLWRLSSLDKSVEGVTGSIYFDEHNDAVKSIPVGIFKNGKPIPALYQYQPLSDLKSIDNLLQEVLDNQIVTMNGKFMRRAQVVYTGLDFNEISDLDTKTASFSTDFYIWFRFQGKFDDSNIEFINILNPKDNSLGKPLIDRVSQVEAGVTTKTYRIKTKFKGEFDFHDYPLDQQLLPVKFRHSSLTRDKLIYVIDTIGMNQQLDRASVISQLEKKKAFIVGGWRVNQLSFFQDTKKNDSTLGIPELFGAQQRIEYSQFNAAIRVERQLLNFILKNLLVNLFLVVMGYAAFFIPISGFATRLGLGTSLIMTTSVFHLKLASELANIDYLVLIEYFFYMIYLLAGFVILMSLMAHVEQGKGRKEGPAIVAKLDRFGKIAYPLVLILGMAIIIFEHWQLLVG
jgi:branched-chain amino acid transport system substrate-binding protein